MDQRPSKASNSLLERAAILAILLVFFAAIGGVLFIYGPHAPFWPKCLFYKFTGWHCPGCGMTRAMSACVRGEVAEAFRYNPVMMVLLPVAGLLVAWHLISWLLGRPTVLFSMLGKRTGIVLLVVVVLFWVLRNLPWWPFWLLAPP